VLAAPKGCPAPGSLPERFVKVGADPVAAATGRSIDRAGLHIAERNAPERSGFHAAVPMGSGDGRCQTLYSNQTKICQGCIHGRNGSGVARRLQEVQQVQEVQEVQSSGFRVRVTALELNPFSDLV
jgi:hypothetical protein